MHRALVCSFSVSWPDWLSHGGIFKETTDGKILSMLNPLSAIKASPGSNKSKTPDCNISFLSEMFPLNHLETKLTAPEGAIPFRAFIVLWFL